VKGFLAVLFVACLVFAAGCQLGPKVEFVKGVDKIDVLVDGNHFTSYLYGSELTKPVLYPVHTPSGIAVNRSYPLNKVEGESTDHPHHVGIFFTYDEVNGSGFWNNTTSPPQVKHLKFTGIKPGPGKGTLSTLMNWVGADGGVVLSESRDMVFIAEPNGYAVDLNIKLRAVGQQVVFEDTKEGMFAIRVADWLREDEGTGQYLSSSGDRSPVNDNIWGKRARWVSLQGQSDGRTVGLAIFNHPDSTNYPTYWHARPYGLFSANPLGQYVFEKKRNPDDAKPFNLTLEPGQVANFRFRVLVYEGSRTGEQLDKEFDEYAGGP